MLWVGLILKSHCFVEWLNLSHQLRASLFYDQRTRQNNQPSFSRTAYSNSNVIKFVYPSHDLFQIVMRSSLAPGDTIPPSFLDIRWWLITSKKKRMRQVNCCFEYKQLIFFKTNTIGSEDVVALKSIQTHCHKFFQSYRPFVSHRYNVDSRSCNISKHVSTVCQTQMTVLTQRWQLPSALKCITLYSLLLTLLKLIYSERLKQLMMIHPE